jgi:hypothetical protein
MMKKITGRLIFCVLHFHKNNSRKFHELQYLPTGLVNFVSRTSSLLLQLGWRGVTDLPLFQIDFIYARELEIHDVLLVDDGARV